MGRINKQQLCGLRLASSAASYVVWLGVALHLSLAERGGSGKDSADNSATTPSLTANTVRRESRSESRGGGSPQAFRVVEGMGFTLILRSAATCRAAKLVFELLAIF
jgi:hypothetical protein